MAHKTMLLEIGNKGTVAPLPGNIYCRQQLRGEDESTVVHYCSDSFKQL